MASKSLDSRVHSLRASEALFALIDSQFVGNDKFSSRNAFIVAAVEEFCDEGLNHKFFDSSPYHSSSVLLPLELYDKVQSKRQANDFIRTATCFKLYRELELIP